MLPSWQVRFAGWKREIFLSSVPCYFFVRDFAFGGGALFWLEFFFTFHSTFKATHDDSFLFNGSTTLSEKEIADTFSWAVRGQIACSTRTKPQDDIKNEMCCQLFSVSSPSVTPSFRSEWYCRYTFSGGPGPERQSRLHAQRAQCPAAFQVSLQPSTQHWTQHSKGENNSRVSGTFLSL